MSSDDPNTTRRRVLFGVGAGATVGLAGCLGNSDDGDAGTDTDTDTPTEEPTNTPTDEETPTEEPEGTANVRVAHLSPNAPNVDVYVDGSVVLEDVPFGAVSEYLEVPAGEREIEITAAGDADTSVFAGAVPVEADTDYTVAATGELGDMADQTFEPLVLEDDNSEPGSDTARIRAVHASPDAPTIDITTASNGDALFDAVEYGESGYVEVPAGEYTLEIRGDTDASDGDVVAEFDVSLAGGQVYTAFAAGYLSPDDEPGDTPFDLLVSQDTNGGMMSTSPGNVRVSHMSPNAPNVDVYVDESVVLEDVPFGTTSDYLELPAGDHTVEITAAGDPETSVFSGTVPVEADTDYTIVAAGELGDMVDQTFEPLILEDDNSSPGEDTARVRAVHVSPDAPAVDITASSTGDTLFNGVGFSGSGYTEVPANDYTLQIRGDTESNDGEVVADFDVSLNGGQVYTAFAAGYLSPDDEPQDVAFDLFVTQDTSEMSN
jgi:hypothetical protein